MFDCVEIVVRGGDGGDGAISFRREKFVPLGGPDGGDGGDGGNVIIRADPSVGTLGRFKPKRVYRAGNGGNGSGKRWHGARGKDIVLSVPVGTVITSKNQVDDEAFLADLDEPGREIVVVRGGRGGFGNSHFTTPTNQAPHIAQKGEAGEEKAIILEMRLIADVGIIGRPNAGKSSLLAAASAARPKIASYPFTTTAPVLGVVELDSRSLIMAEIPGLIEDAHLGRGLGHNFLRHVLRTKVLIHLIDGTSANPVENMSQINAELSLFDSALATKPQLVAVNKIDLPEVRARLDETREAFSQVGTDVFFISAATKEGVPRLMEETARLLEMEERREKAAAKRPPRKVFRPQPRKERVNVRREGDIFVIECSELERIVARTGVGPGVAVELEKEFSRLGVNRALEKAGARPGVRIRCGNLEWEW